MAKLSLLIILLVLFTGEVFSEQEAVSRKLSANRILITDFEDHPNYLGGDVRAYGAAGSRERSLGDRAYSGYSAEEVHSGSRSYRLALQKHLRPEEREKNVYDKFKSGFPRMEPIEELQNVSDRNWAVLSIELGEVIDDKKIPVGVKPLDVSDYRYLVFWVKGQRGGEKFLVGFRDAEAHTYDPQVKVKPKLAVRTEWRQVKINLVRLSKKVDLSKLVAITINFGRPEGARGGDVFYVDDFMLVK